MYYDRKGCPIRAAEWVELFENFEGYRRLGETHLPNGYLISTVWLGLDHMGCLRKSAPVIFESMVFRDARRDRESYDQVRYTTEAEALAGHKQLVHRWAMKRRRRPGVYSRRLTRSEELFL